MYPDYDEIEIRSDVHLIHLNGQTALISDPSLNISRGASGTTNQGCLFA